MNKCRKYFKNIPENKGINLIYDILLNCFGSQDWWPGEPRFEIIVGAILTQAVNWRNVKKSIAVLKENNLLQPELMLNLEKDKLAEKIKSSGYYNMKALKLKKFLQYLFDNYNGKLEEMFEQPLSRLRKELLKVYGIGPETADSILLYAGNYRTFVVDAYTRRIFYRIGYAGKKIKYEELKELISREIPDDLKIYQDYHALLVVLGKNYCKKNNPGCDSCPINLS